MPTTRVRQALAAFWFCRSRHDNNDDPGAFQVVTYSVTHLRRPRRRGRRHRLRTSRRRPDPTPERNLQHAPHPHPQAVTELQRRRHQRVDPEAGQAVTEVLMYGAVIVGVVVVIGAALQALGVDIVGTHRRRARHLAGGRSSLSRTRQSSSSPARRPGRRRRRARAGHRVSCCCCSPRSSTSSCSATAKAPCAPPSTKPPAPAPAADSVAMCQATADQVMGDLLGGALGADVNITCSDAGRTHRRHRHRPLRGLADLARRLRRHASPRRRPRRTGDRPPVPRRPWLRRRSSCRSASS